MSAFWVGVGGEFLLGDVVSEFCDTDKSVLSHWCIPPQGLFHIATPLCNRAKWLSYRGRAAEDFVGGCFVFVAFPLCVVWSAAWSLAS